MIRHATFLLLLLTIDLIGCYWDRDREITKNPQHDNNTNCDLYCKNGLPSYMNWREGMDYRERQGISTIIGSTKHGPVEGISVPGVHDTSSFVNIFLGIPYAKPPVGLDMFKEAQPVQDAWDAWDATYYRPACPQVEDLIQEDIPGFAYTNEDCLHINVFQPNVTNEGNSLRTYPVLVFIHGGGFTRGSAIQYPGIVLAQRDMVVVTFNYRLGPYGFLSLEDNSVVPGNMGLSDQVMALRWVQENIHRFRGRRDEVTLLGHEAGAACVGIHMLSPISRGLFHRAILMSGSDLSPWAVMNSTQAPKEYARDLAAIVGCGGVEGEAMIRCLRSRSPPDIVNAAEKVTLRNGHYKETAGPFAPTIDFYDDNLRWLRAMPAELRKDPDNIMKIDVMGGFAKDDGAWILNKNFSHIFADIQSGVSKEEFRKVVHNVTVRRRARNERQVDDAIEFLYTWWVNPDNSTARRKMLIDVFTDELYASGVDAAMKSTVKALQNTGKNAFMYRFDYRSEKDNASTYWMGAYHNYDVQFLFGWPYIAANVTYQKLMSITLDRQYNELDRNISNGTMQMWKDFAKSGDPTLYPLNPTMPWNFRNLTWYPMSVSNLTYFQLDYNSTNEKEYHQSQLAFWQDYIYDILYLEPYNISGEVGEQGTKVADCPKSSYFEPADPKTGKGLLNLTLSNSSYLKMYLPLGVHPFQVVNSHGENCTNSTVTIYDGSALPEKRMEFEAKYKVECKNWRNNSLLGDTVISTMKQHLALFEELCAGACHMNRQYRWECNGGEATLIWSTNTTYNSSVLEVPSTLKTPISKRLINKGIALPIVILNRRPPVVYPIRNGDGSSAAVVLSPFCGVGRTYHQKSNLCLA